MSKPDCIIVGGGVIGLSLAWVLSQQGVSVQLVEGERDGHGTSWAGVGILPPANVDTANDPIERLRALSHQLHAQWAAELAAATGIDNGYRRCGGIYLAMSRGEQASLVGLADYWREYQIDASRLDARSLTEIEPALGTLAQSDRLQSAWVLPDESLLRSPDHLRALSTACQMQGVQITAGCEIDQVRVEGGNVDHLVSSAGKLSARQYCFATGAWTSRLLDPIGVSTGILPVRGQVLLYRLPQQILRRVVNEGNRYLVPRDDGHLLVGSNEEEVGFQWGTTERVMHSLKTWAEGILPLLASQPIVKSWSGLRPGSFDGFPYIGKLPQLSNAFVAAGHYRSGLHLSCATATELANLMLGRPTQVDLSPFSPSRGYRSRGRK
ncbi:MAG: glycine oxidase ThiO [Pirellulaceae bacterium]